MVQVGGRSDGDPGLVGGDLGISVRVTWVIGRGCPNEFVEVGLAGFWGGHHAARGSYYFYCIFCMWLSARAALGPM